jgi:3-mercaptopyruvate sulfurtransferase SseA
MPEPAMEYSSPDFLVDTAWVESNLSHRTTDLPFMLPPADKFAEVMARLGVDDDVRVVLYDTFFNN